MALENYYVAERLRKRLQEKPKQPKKRRRTPERLCARCGRKMKRKYHKYCVRCEKELRRIKKQTKSLTATMKENDKRFKELFKTRSG